MKNLKAWLVKFFKDKLNIAFVACLLAFFIFAPLTYVWSYFVYVAIVALAATLFVAGLMFIRYHNKYKNFAISLDNITIKQYKYIKRRLFIIKCYIISCFLFSLVILLKLFY